MIRVRVILRLLHVDSEIRLARKNDRADHSRTRETVSRRTVSSAAVPQHSEALESAASIGKATQKGRKLQPRLDMPARKPPNEASAS